MLRKTGCVSGPFDSHVNRFPAPVGLSTTSFVEADRREVAIPSVATVHPIARSLPSRRLESCSLKVGEMVPARRYRVSQTGRLPLQQKNRVRSAGQIAGI